MRKDSVCVFTIHESLPALISPEGLMRLLTEVEQHKLSCQTRSNKHCCSTSILRLGVIKNGAQLSLVSSQSPSLCGVPDLSWLIALSVALVAADS